MQSNHKPQDWQKVSTQSVYKNKWFEITNDSYVIPETHKDVEFYLINHGNGAIIVSKMGDGKYILTEQYRPAVGRVFYDFPAGAIEPNEDALMAAKRELLEETGCQSDDWNKLGHLSPLPSRSTELNYGFYARNCQETRSQNLDKTESINLVYKTKEEIIAMIQTNEFYCASCIALFYKTLLLEVSF